MKITTQLFGELAFLPLPTEAPCDEVSEWLTDILPSQKGGENRIQLRTTPRHNCNYSIPLQAWNTAKAFNTAYGALRKLWAVPLWMEAQYVGTVSAGALAVNCDVNNFDLRARSLALLWRDDLHWQIVEIDSLGESQINLLYAASLVTGAYLIPVRLGYLNGNWQNKTNGHNGKLSLSFDIEDPLFLEAPTPEQYLSKDIYFNAGLLDGGSTSRTISKQSDILDVELGPVARRSPWTYSRYGSTRRTITTSAAEMRAYRLFLHRRAGKYREFWLPTFEQHLRLASVGNIASSLVIEADSFNEYTFRPHIAISDLSGNWYAREVSNPVPVIGNRLQLTLSAALNIDAAKIANVCYLGLNRLDTDRVEINWLGNNVAESSISVLELKP